MKPEYLIARAHSFLQPAPRVELCDFCRPSVTYFDPRNERLTDVEFLGNRLLRKALCYTREDGEVASIKLFHSLTLPIDNVQRLIKFLHLDINIRSNRQEETLHVRRARNGIDKQRTPTILYARGASVLLNAPITKAIKDRIKRWPMGIGKTNANTAFIPVDFNAAFAVKEARKVAEKGGFAPFFHTLMIRCSASRVQLAVPVIGWILERIALQHGATA